MTWEMKCLSSLSARWNFYPQKKNNMMISLSFKDHFHDDFDVN